MKEFISICFLLIAPVVSCGKNDTETKPKGMHLTKKEQVLVGYDNTFGFNLFKEIIKNEDSQTNILISPLSISYALAMTYNGADGTTKKAMEETLNLSGLTIDEINNSYNKLITALLSMDSGVIMSIANSIWYRNTFNVEQSFINVNKNYYNAEVTPLDFKSTEAIDIINNWVADKTKNKIIEIIDHISPAAVMYLINAIYFKGIWKYEFDKDNTNEAPFYLDNGTSKDVPMMVQEGTFNYLSNELFQAVEMPYGSGNYSMLIFLPAYNKTVNDIIEQLNNENWNNWLDEFNEENKVQIHLPKYKYDYEITLNDELINMGMSIAFSSAADFSKIDQNGGLYISKVKHKTFIEVNEEGTEAAAVTSIEILRSIIDFIPFYVNKPFLFAIKEKNTNAIIFMGKIVEPLYED